MRFVATNPVNQRAYCSLKVTDWYRLVQASIVLQNVQYRPNSFLKRATTNSIFHTLVTKKQFDGKDEDRDTTRAIQQRCSTRAAFVVSTNGDGYTAGYCQYSNDN